MSEVTLEVQERSALGKGGNRRTRAAGLIPGVVYGGGRESVAIQIDRRTFAEMFRRGASENQIFLLKLTGTDKSRHAMIRELDIDPMTRKVRHIDFQRVLMTEKIRVQVPIELVGIAYGVKNDAAVLDFVTREITVECLPAEIPSKIALDVTELRVHQHVEASQLELPRGVELLESGDRVIVSLAHSKTEKAAEATAAGETLVEATAAEPEVIKKGKLEAEGEKPVEAKSDKGKK